MVCLGLGSMLAPTSAHANGKVPDGCSMLNGVIVCTDGATTSSGTNCVTDAGTLQSFCYDGTSGQQIAKDIRALGRGLGSVVHQPVQTTGTGWLSRITGWFAYAINQVFGAVVQVLKDLVTYLVAVVLDLVKWMIAAIPVPDWIADNSLGSLLGQTGDIAGFFMVQLRIPAALALIGGGYAFRLIRKFLTLFQW